MELFKKMGPRVILVEYHGRLVGLVTVKDCLKYQFRVEKMENPRDPGGDAETDQRVWEGLGKIGGWIGDAFGSLRRGKLRLPSPTTAGRPNGHAGFGDREDDGREVELDDR